MSNYRTIIMLCPAAHVAVANAAFAKLGVGPQTLSAKYAAASDPATITHYMCNWDSVSASLTATIGQMISGTLPTECLDEFDRPITVTWDSPTEAEALTAMSSITFKSIAYDDPADYNAQAEVASVTETAGLVLWQDPNAPPI